MLNIPKQLWYTIQLNDSGENLAYMTYTDGSQKEFEKRKKTGLRWAVSYVDRSPVQAEEHYIDNEPVSGFKIVGVKRRYSTDNKVFDIEDPRGFTVQVPAVNLLEIIENSTIVNGVIQEPCMWGRLNSGHILVPEDSELHKSHLQLAQAIQKKVPMKKIQVGDICVDKTGKKFIYMGTARTVFEFTVEDFLRQSTRKETYTVTSPKSQHMWFLMDNNNPALTESCVDQIVKCNMFIDFMVVMGDHGMGGASITLAGEKTVLELVGAVDVRLIDKIKDAPNFHELVLRTSPNSDIFESCLQDYKAKHNVAHPYRRHKLIKIEC